MSRGSARPKRSLGQNFLTDGRIAERIAAEVRIDRGQTVLEVGAGRGALSERLIPRVEAEGGRLILVELDDDLAAELMARYEERSEITVIHEDILRVSPRELADPRELSVVGNIPYNLTSPILFHLLAPPRPREILLMVQREVGDRILAPPGTRQYGALSVGVRAVAEVERVLRVSSEAFRPRPRVESTVLRIQPRQPSPIDARQESQLRELTRSLFQWRRKQLGRILRDHPDLRLPRDRLERALQAADASPTDRPEVLSPADFISMAEAIAD